MGRLQGTPHAPILPLSQDALADNNAWEYCAFDGSLPAFDVPLASADHQDLCTLCLRGNGFPGTCSPTGTAFASAACHLCHDHCAGFCSKAKTGQASYIPVPGCTGKSSKAPKSSVLSVLAALGLVRHGPFARRFPSSCTRTKTWMRRNYRLRFASHCRYM